MSSLLYALRSSRGVLVALTAFGVLATPSWASANVGNCSYTQANGGDFLLVIEAENFPGNISRLGDTWQVPGNPVQGFSGAAAVQALPDNSTTVITNYAQTSPELSVAGNFSITGTHYVWVRGHGVKGGSDSLHIGLDGNEIPTAAAISIPRSSGYEWSDGTDTLNIGTTGIHTLEAWMREDGTYFDKLVITTNSSYVPTGVGPAESNCGSTGDMPPVLDAIGPQSVVEGELLNFAVTASDDNGAPVLSVAGLPTGATFDPATGVFDWTPGSGTSGSVSVTFTATDSANQTDIEQVVITVSAAGGGGVCSYQQSGNGANLLIVEAENFPTNTPRSGDTWEIPTNPVQGFSGSTALQTLPDNRDIFRTGFANTSPELEVTATFASTGTHYVWVRGHGSKGGSDSLHFGLDGQELATSTGISIPRTSGYEWSNGTHTVNVTSAGVHSLNVWMREDGTYFDKVVLTTDPNFVPTGFGPTESSCSGNGSGDQPPVLAPIGAQSVQEGTTLSFAVTASDDNGTPALSATNLPVGASFAAGSGQFSWTPGSGDVGSYNVTFIATDSANQTDSEQVVITVSAAGGGGVCSYQQSGNGANLLIVEAENFPTNTPRSGDTWEIPTNPVQGFSGSTALQTLPDNRDIFRTGFANTSPELEVTATFASTGTHYVWVRGHGSKGGSDSLHFGLDGQELATSTGISIPRTSGYEWSNGTHTVNVTSAGVHSLNVWMREDGTYFDKVVLTTDPNFVPTGFGPTESSCSGNGSGDQPPVLAPIGAQSVQEGTTLSFAVTASDDNGTPALSATNLPVGASFAAGSGQFSWTPGSGDVGSYNVTFIATDSANQTDTEVVGITVSAGNGGGGNDQPPTLDPIGNQTGAEQSPLGFAVSASDDNGSPTLSATGLPAGATFAPATGLFDWTPPFGASVNSPYSVVFTATDSANQTDSETVQIIVGAPSQSPFLQGSGPDEVVSLEGESFHGNIPRAADEWQVPGSLIAGFSGATAMQVLPDNGGTITSGYEITSPQMRYEVEFVTTGRHYIWVRGAGTKGGSDSVHVGLDGVESAGGAGIGIPRTTPASYQWSSGAQFVDVNSAGLHTIDIWMREDGTYVDKIVASTNAAFNPTGLGPQQSFRVSDCQVFPSTQIASPQQDELQTSTTIEVETHTCLDNASQAGWGVKFELNGGFSGGGSEQIVTSAPYTATFSDVAQAEHIIDIVLVNAALVEQTGGDVTDSVSNVGVGDYYVAVGDSITFGIGDDISSDDTSIDGRNSGGGYTPILNDLLTSAKGYPHRVENAGVPGDTTLDGLLAINSIIAQHPNANFYLMKFGMNDARPNATTPSGLGLALGDAGYAGSYKDNMQQMIDAITLSGAQVVVAMVNPALGDSATGNQYPNPETGTRTVNIIEFNLVIGELVAENSLSVTGPDLYDYFLMNFSTEYGDNIHPNGVGYQSMADLWANQL